MEDYFRVGVIAKKLGIDTSDKTRFIEEEEGGANYYDLVSLDTGSEKKVLEVASARFFKNLVILKFKGIDSINDIEKYKGKDLLVTRENAIPLNEGEYYIADIIGATVVTEDGAQFGILKDVLTTGANDVYVVDHEGTEVLLPVIPDCVLARDMEQKIVTVHIMKGLM